MRYRPLLLLASLLFVAAGGSSALAHCEIPCGIFNDPMRFAMMEEEVTTIEKSMTEIERLAKEAKPNWNQIVRWVNNKDTHADELSHIATYYFLAQRIKPVDPQDKAAYAKYVYQLTLIHQIVVFSMKSKQTTDLENCARLRGLIAKFKTSYLPAQPPKVAAGEARSHEHAASAPPSSRR